MYRKKVFPVSVPERICQFPLYLVKLLSPIYQSGYRRCHPFNKHFKCKREQVCLSISRDIENHFMITSYGQHRVYIQQRDREVEHNVVLFEVKLYKYFCTILFRSNLKWTIGYLDHLEESWNEHGHQIRAIFADDEVTQVHGLFKRSGSIYVR
jgi:hypothetical protein